MRTRHIHKLDSAYSWLVCIGATVSNGVGNSLVFSFGVFLPALMTEFNQSREKTALICSLTFAIACFVSPVTGKLCHGFGCQRTHILGTLTCAFSLITSSWATGIPYLYISLCIFYGFGMSSIFMPCFVIVSNYFHKRHSLAIGFVAAGSSIGFFIFGPITQALLDSVGWRNSYRILSGGMLGCCFVSLLFNSNVEKKEIQESECQRGSERNPHNSACSIWKIPSFTIPVIYFTIVVFSHYSPPIHMVRYFEEMGISRKKSSYLFIGLGLGSLSSRIAVGKICEYVSPVRVNQVAILCSGASTLLLAMKSSYVILVVLMIIYGLADGAFVTTFNVIILISVDPDKRAFAFGFANMATSVSIAIGPMITGLVADRYSYHEAFLMTGSITLTGMLVSLFPLCFKKKMNEQENVLKEKLIVYEMVTVL